jgi:hypothetical protein
MTQTLYEKSMEVREVLLRDKKILRTLRNIFTFQYQDGSKPTECRVIGVGSENIIYSAGRLILEDELFLALRLKEAYSPSMRQVDLAGNELISYCGLETVRFQLAVDYRDLGGILTQDLTEGGKFEIESSQRKAPAKIPGSNEEIDFETLVLTRGDERKEFAVDAWCPPFKEIKRADKYLLPEARIDIP